MRCGYRGTRLRLPCVILLLVGVALASREVGVMVASGQSLNPTDVFLTSTQSGSVSSATSGTTVVPTVPTELGSCQCDQTFARVTSASSSSSSVTAAPSLEACDVNCCCDPDCQSLNYLFSVDANGATSCRPEGPAPPTVEYCAAAEVQRVNLPKSSSFIEVTKVKAQDGFLSSQLCIVQDNNAAYGNFFSDPGPGTAFAVSAAKESPDYNEWISSRILPSASQPSLFSSFKANASIPFAYNQTATELRERESGFFKLPSSVYSAACDQINVVGFMFDVPFSTKQQLTANGAGRNRCEVAYDDLSTACTANAHLDLHHYINTDWVGRNDAASPGSPSSYVNVVLTNLTRTDIYTGSSSSVGISGALPSPSVTPPPPGSTRVVCSDVVVGVQYTVLADRDLIGGVISTDVQVSITIASGVVASAPGVPGAVSIEYGVVWKDRALRDEAAAAAGGANATVVNKVSRSGNPGYMNHFPVLAGVQEVQAGSADTVFKQFARGLPLPTAAPDGTCSINFSEPAFFGANSVSGCKLRMSLRQLREFCQGTTAPSGAGGASTLLNAFNTYASETRAEVAAGTCADTAISPGAATPLPAQIMRGLAYDCPTCVDPTSSAGAFSGKPTLVGSWGNADYTNGNDWLRVQVNHAAQSGTQSMQWLNETRTCTNVVNSVAFDFLIGGVGAVHNVQRKITFASATYGSTQDWTWYGDDESCTADFDVVFRTSFVRMKDQVAVEGKTPDPPPLAPTFPADIFYPFLSSTTPAGATGASIAVALLIIAVGLFLPVIR